MKRWLRIGGREGVHGELDEEFAFHLAMRTAALRAEGYDEAEARWRAAAEFGDIEQARERCAREDRMRQRRSSVRRVLETVRQDARHGVRQLRRSPGFAVAALLTIALGIGANAAIFAVVRSVLLRSFGWAQESELYTVWGADEGSTSPRGWVDLRAAMSDVSDVGAYSGWSFVLGGDDQPVQVSGARVTANLFGILGARPLLGRTFVESDGEAGANVAIISYALWQSRFAGDPNVVGKPLRIDGLDRTIIAVMPPEFTFLDRDAMVWHPFYFDPETIANHGGYLTLVVRSAMREEALLAALHTAGEALHRDMPERYEAGWTTGAFVRPLREHLVGPVRSMLLIVMGAAVFVLLLACANIANLLIARSTAREREFAVRASLGAGRARLAGQLVVEAYLLALCGAVVGTAAAYGLLPVLASLLPIDVVDSSRVRIDAVVLLFAFGLAGVAALLCGAVPALRVASADLSMATREGGRGGIGRARKRVLAGLVAVEVACALVLTIGAGLMIRSFQRLQDESPGFVAANVLSLRVSPPGIPGQTTEEQWARATQQWRDIIERVTAIGGVERAGAIQLLPFSGSNWNPSIVAESRPDVEATEVDWRLITPDFFHTMGIPVLRGRVFDDTDRGDSPEVGIINQTLARRLFGDADAIGERVNTGFEGDGNWVTVVGVVSDSKDQTLRGEARPQLFRPHTQYPVRSMTLMVRSSRDPQQLAREVRDAVWSIDPTAPVAEVQTMETVIADSLDEPRTLSGLLTIFGALALVLGGIGIYGVTAYLSRMRYHEFGVRLALGARHGELARLVLGGALRQAAVGLVIGLGAAAMLSRVLASQTYGISATDPLTYVSISAVICVVALVGALAPALRASRLPASRVLGAE